MKLNTRHFGEIEVPEDVILDFEEGIPGFPDSKHFVLLEEPEDENDTDTKGLFYWLQSVDEPEITLVVMDVTRVMPEYDPLVNLEELENLGDPETETFCFYNVVVIPDQIEKMSVNLRAPIVINDRLKRGRQVLSNNEEYVIRYYIIEELNRK